MNQEWERGETAKRVCLARVLRGSDGNMQIIAKREICQRWGICVAGRKPDKKLTTDDGELTDRFKIFWRLACTAGPAGQSS